MSIKKILIIEDDLDISQTLGEVITGMGLDIEIAHNGKEGMDHLINNPLLPDLIILDLFLPVMNGAEFRQRQLQIPHLATIPVVAMSADCCVKQRCHALHVSKFLKKPFNIEELAEIINSFG